MNCPNCVNGVLESIGHIPIQNGSLSFVFGRLPETNIPALQINICSREDCRFVYMEAAPNSLPLAKRTMRELAYAAGNCPIQDYHSRMKNGRG